MSPSDRVAQFYPQAPASVIFVFYGWLDYGGRILTRLHTGKFVKYFLQLGSKYYIFTSPT
jgi:hypothetical protein